MAVPAFPAAGCTKTLSNEAALQRGDQQRVQAQAAGEAEVPARARHANHGFFDGALNAGRQRRAQRLRHGGSVLQAEAAA